MEASQPKPAHTRKSVRRRTNVCEQVRVQRCIILTMHVRIRTHARCIMCMAAYAYAYICTCAYVCMCIYAYDCMMRINYTASTRLITRELMMIQYPFHPAQYVSLSTSASSSTTSAFSSSSASFAPATITLPAPATASCRAGHTRNQPHLRRQQAEVPQLRGLLCGPGQLLKNKITQKVRLVNYDGSEREQ